MNNGYNKVKVLLWSGLFLLIPIAIQFWLGLIYAIQLFKGAFQQGFSFQMNQMQDPGAIAEYFEESIELMKQGWMMILLTLLADVAMLACYGLWYYFREKKYGFRPDYKKGLSVNNVLCIIGIGVFGQYAISLLMLGVKVTLPSVYSSYEEMAQIFDLSTAPTWLMILTICLIGPIAEEVMFRGMIYGCIRRAFSMWPTAIISGVLFGVYHMNIIQGIYATIFGVVLGLVYEKTQTIWGSILLHVTFNSTSYLAEWVEKQVLDSSSQALHYGYIAFEIISVVVIFFLVRKVHYKVEDYTTQLTAELDSDSANSL